jgi:hypothetical protein
LNTPARLGLTLFGFDFHLEGGAARSLKLGGPCQPLPIALPQQQKPWPTLVGSGHGRKGSRARVVTASAVLRARPAADPGMDGPHPLNGPRPGYHAKMSSRQMAGNAKDRFEWNPINNGR